MIMATSLMHQQNLNLGPYFASFKLYDNPYYSYEATQQNQIIHNYKKPSDPSLTMQSKATQNEIEQLKAELEFERKMRRKVESLNQVLAMELAEERRAREEAEQGLKLLESEVTCNRAEVEKALSEIEEERRMLRIAELWREERVQMKLSEAKLLMEEKIKEIAEFVCSEEAAAAAAVARKAEEVGPTCQTGCLNQQRKEAENPHIKRGIKGFVEFPKAIRVQFKQERIDLECQRAQFRVLLRNKSTSNALDLMPNTQNLNLVM